MTRRPTARLAGYVAILALGAYVAVAIERIALLALVVPFAIWVLAGLASASAPELELKAELDRDRITEDGEACFTAEVTCRGRVAWLELELDLPRELDCAEPGAGRRLRSQAVGTTTVRWRLQPRRWGTFRCGPIRLRAQDPLGLVTYSAQFGPPAALRVYPAFERLRQLVAPARTQLFAGNRIARRHGEGIEFASIRDFSSGDRVRRINWRATARTGTPHVNDFHLERNADVILFVD
ncbi:MAG TPA: DUF58 domain-containing protein, partial [Candidatus Dormibacteraeota bacterium]